MSDPEADQHPADTANHPHIALLRQVRMFEDLPDPLLLRLSAVSERTSVSAGTRLCREGEPAERLHFLLEGQVALFAQAPDGRDALIEVIRPIRHVVLGSVLARLPYAVNADIIARSTLLSIEVGGLQRLLEDSTQFAATILRVQASDFSAMVRQVCDLKMRTAAERLGVYLLELAQEHPRDARELRLPTDKQLLAARLGCRQENLSRAFASLRSLGVETHGRRVVLHDVEALRGFIFPASAGAKTSA